MFMGLHIVINFYSKRTRCTSVSNLFYFGMTLHMFRTVFLSITSSRQYIQQQAYVKHLVPASKQTAVSVWHVPVAVCTVLNSWWWTERPSETCRVSFLHSLFCASDTWHAKHNIIHKICRRHIDNIQHKTHYSRKNTELHEPVTSKLNIHPNNRR